MKFISGFFFNRFYCLLCSIIFVIVALRAFFIPFSHDEAATFFFYVQSDNYLPYSAHIYTNNHVLNSALTNICYHILGSHRFVLRIPNLIAFLIMCYGIYRFFRHLKTISSKLILIAFFLLTFNFLDFFELCRGYGLSFGFMTLGLSYLMDYFLKKDFSYILLFSLCWQLALAANLILVVCLTILLFYVLVFQIRYKLFLNIKNILLQAINIFLLIFWIKFSFFYKEQGVLDYGVGTNYWAVTFKTLILFLFDTDQLWIQIISLTAFAFIFILSLISFLNKPFSVFNVFKKDLFFPVILITCLLAFYFQKKILNVNYPEDRTGLFFYLFFVLSFAFLLDGLPKVPALAIACSILTASCIYFFRSINLTDYTSLYYHTMPKAVFDKLTDEYKKTKQIFTIGGHRVREMNYAFLNYRGGAILNHMDDAEQMIMNCDFYFAMKREKPYYERFYDEIAEDKTWDRVLLKRKEKINKTQLIALPDVPKNYSGNKEYFEFLRFDNKLVNSANCLEAEVAIKFNKMPQPFNGELVFNIVNEKNEMVYFKRVPLNWLADNLSGETKYFKLTTGLTPKNGFTAVVFIWNIDKQEVDFTLKDLKIHELNGRGVNFSIPANFYPLIETITKQSLL
ncbi:MAG: hypothetical protein H0U95_10810 [Bacteroidetes bacterium]|nr:hypothetical protein [Bacteroidota bacterium]